jgi:hypothetical protein
MDTILLCTYFVEAWMHRDYDYEDYSDRTSHVNDIKGGSRVIATHRRKAEDPLSRDFTVLH